LERRLLVLRTMSPNTSSSDISSTSNAEILRELFRKILHSLLGESAGETVLLLLEKNLQQDLGRTLWEDPRRIYYELFKIFGEGTKVLINIMISRINQEFKLNIESEKIMKLACSKDQSSAEELRSIMRLIVKLYRDFMN